MLIRELIQSVKQNCPTFGRTGDLVRDLAGRKVTRVFAVFAMTATVAACSTVNETSHASAYNNSCMAERADIVDAAQWDEVRPYRIRIVNGEIHPMVIYVEENRPYIFQVRNADRADHDLWSPEFFKQAAAVESVQFGDKAATKGCVNGIRIKGRSTVTIRFVPVWEGRYEVFNSSTFLRAPTGPDAVVHIIPQRIGLAQK